MPGWRTIRKPRYMISSWISSVRLADREGRQPSRHLALLRHTAHLRHHLLHFFKLLEKLFHLMNRGAAPLGDPCRSPSPDDLGIASLVRSHGVDDRFDPLIVVIRDLRFGLSHLRAQTRDHLQELAQRSHLLDLLQLLEKILQIELTLEHPIL